MYLKFDFYVHLNICFIKVICSTNSNTPIFQTITQLTTLHYHVIYINNHNQLKLRHLKTSRITKVILSTAIKCLFITRVAKEIATLESFPTLRHYKTLCQLIL